MLLKINNRLKIKSLTISNLISVILFGVVELGVFATNSNNNGNGSNSSTTTHMNLITLIPNPLNQTSVFLRSSPSPSPAKSLYNNGPGAGHLFQYQPQQHQHSPPEKLLKTLLTTSFPLRESYIAFEQGYPVPPTTTYSSGGGFGSEEYFKPNRFTPTGFDSSEYYATKLQNNYPVPYHHHQQYPSSSYPPQQSHHHSPFHPLPPAPPPPPFLRLVKIPGELKVRVGRSAIPGGRDLEILCEFPAYILIVQQIYWHVIPPPGSPILPYGTFYDSTNGFAPRVQVIRLSKWRSLLKVQDYSVDDYGTYRCVSTAILPDDPPTPSSPSPDTNYNFGYRPTRTSPPPYHPPPSPPSTATHPFTLHFPYEAFNGELRSSASTIVSNLGGEYEERLFPEDLIRDERAFSSRKIKFVRKKRDSGGAFGVYAPFFKPHYGIYRVFKEVKFYGDHYGSGSENVENTLSPEVDNDPEVLKSKGEKNAHKNSTTTSGNTMKDKLNKLNRNGRRKFDHERKSKVLF